MEELAMCRICLAKDVRLRLIASTHLQEMYESLTLLPLETKDCRPVRVCYICCAGLHNCFQLRKRCLRSEELFTWMLSTDMIQQLNVPEACSQRLSVKHPVIHLSFGDVLQNHTTDGNKTNKQASPEASVPVGHGTMQQRVLTDIKIEPQEEYDIEIDDIIQYAHIDDTPNVVKREPNDVDDAEDIQIKQEDIIIEESEPHDVYKTSQSVYSVCPKIVKVVLERLVLNDTIPSSGVPALKKPAETNYLFATEPKDVNKNIIDKQIYNKVTGHDESQEPTDEKPNQCDICNKCFTFKANLQRHMHTHSTEKPYKCDVCKKCFKVKRSVSRHMYIHFKKDSKKEKRYQCHVCNKCFTKKSNLTQHHYIHTGEKRFQCDVCKKCFTTKFNLMEHQYVHTGKKQFQCDICYLWFTYKSRLTKHLLTHTTEKRVQCHMCNMWLRDKASLKCHLYDKKYACGKGDFTYTTYIKKKIQCDVCNKYFSRKVHLKEHMYTHR